MGSPHTLTQRVALVTGASRGIGLACTRALARVGWRVILVARDESRLAAAAGTLPQLDHRTVATDLLTAHGRARLFESLDGETPDAIVQCLGGHTSPESLDPWLESLLLNFHAVVAINEHLLPAMLERGSGRLVHMSSSAAANGRASTPYACSKAALNRYIANRGRECLRHGVTMCGLMPAAVEGDGNTWARIAVDDPARHARMASGQTLGRAQTTDEIAVVVAFLCSQSAGIFGGCILPADATLAS